MWERERVRERKCERESVLKEERKRERERVKEWNKLREREKES